MLLINGAFFQDGAWDSCGRAVWAAERAVHLVLVTSAREAGSMTLPRNLVVVEGGGSIECCWRKPYWNRRRAIGCLLGDGGVVGDEAVVEHLKLQGWQRLQGYHFSSSLQRAAGSSLQVAPGTFHLPWARRFSRNDIRAHARR